MTIFLVAGNVTTFNDLLEMSSSLHLNSHIISTIVSPWELAGSADVNQTSV